MFWIIAAVIAALVMLFLMEKARDVELDPDPVFQSVLAVDRLCDEIASWETNLWSLWAMALIENLLFRLDKSDRLLYLNKLENQIINLQEGEYKVGPMSEKSDLFTYFEQEIDDLQAH